MNLSNFATASILSLSMTASRGNVLRGTQNNNNERILQTFDYCGGNVDANAISCSSFPGFLKSDSCAWDDGSGAYNKFTGGKDGAWAWANPNDWSDDCSANYWVIHGCDQSGTQMGDNAGNAGIYIERFGPLTDSCNPNSYSSVRGDDGDWLHPDTRNRAYPKDACVDNECCDGTSDQSDGNCKGTYWSDHQKSFFQHPATGNKYATYESGWWSPYGWPDCDLNVAPYNWERKPWCDNLVENGPIPPVSNDDKNDPNTMFAMIYPWVCTMNNDDWGQFWGDKNGYGGHDLPFGSDTPNTMCYADNEPWDHSGHFTSNSPPPVWQAIKFQYNDDGHLDAWVVYEKKYNDDTGHYVGTPFNLQGQASRGAGVYGGGQAFPY